MQIVAAIFAVFINFIMYLFFGSLICIGKDRKWSLALTIVVGFFFYYALFAVVCFPIMLTYRPLSLLSKVWIVVVIIVAVLSIICSRKAWIIKARELYLEICKAKSFYAIIFLCIIFQVILVVTTYNFTLDAAYYVANVTTSVDTNMINVYDPFTGVWQDHFELRYVFATYPIHDAVLCSITKIPALVWCKSVMAAVVMILANALYIWISGFLCKEDYKKRLIMFITIIFVNLTFITLYTTSNFLMTRTYEGKSIVGNIVIVAIFAMYMYAVRYEADNYFFAILFTICLGATTISSTANMVVPAQICVLFAPYVIKHKKYNTIVKFIVCMLPEVIMMLMYVLYVKGYFAIYTYPR